MHSRPFGSLALNVLLLLAQPAWSSDAPQFRFPVDCEIGRTCVIQNYVDRDASPAAQDYSCGTLTYDGHNGTDIRLLTLAAQRAGVAVVAAAGGIVTRTRDEMPDQILSSFERAAAAKGRECGNGVVVDHPDGWQTQYCHMAQGSIEVKPGERIKAGHRLGKIGLSGLTEYPHLHFTVRHLGKVVDPFAFGADENACGGGTSLWEPSVRSQLTYKSSLVLNAGFSAGPVSMETIESGEAGEAVVAPNSPALVAFVRAIGLKNGDIQQLIITSPDGSTIVDHTAQPLDRNKAQAMIFAGAKRRAAAWPRGTYTATYTVRRNGSIALAHKFERTL